MSYILLISYIYRNINHFSSDDDSMICEFVIYCMGNGESSKHHYPKFISEMEWVTKDRIVSTGHGKKSEIEDQRDDDFT